MHAFFFPFVQNYAKKSSIIFAVLFDNISVKKQEGRTGLFWGWYHCKEGEYKERV
jgi:hypothetical protein